jgi:KDO2-lipid IV(A) lauroyltransferase
VIFDADLKLPMRFTGYFLLRLTVLVFSIIPFRLLYVFADGLYFVLSRLFRYRYSVIKSNLKKSFPEKPETDIHRLIDLYYRHFSDLLFESIKGLTMTKAEFKRRFVYKNPEIFTPFFDKNQNVILLGSHYGNWEWGVLSFPLAVNHDVVGVFKPLKNEPVNAFLNNRRKQWGLNLVSMQFAGREMLTPRKTPGIFVLIADQTPSDVINAHWIDFLNQDTPFLQGADKIARQTGHPVFMFDVQRIRRGFYEVTFLELCRNPKNLEEGEITRRFARQLEIIIQEKPPDWLWSHRRWKRQRPGDH